MTRAVRMSNNKYLKDTKIPFGYGLGYYFITFLNYCQGQKDAINEAI